MVKICLFFEFFFENGFWSFFFFFRFRNEKRKRKRKEKKRKENQTKKEKEKEKKRKEKKVEVLMNSKLILEHVASSIPVVMVLVPRKKKMERDAIM